MKTKISRNFDLKEFLSSEQKLDTIPTTEEIINIVYLVDTVLQPLRDYLGSKVFITSGLRSLQKNKQVGGAKYSQHLTGQAADIICIDNAKAFQYIINNLTFDQLIWKLRTELQPAWIHVSATKFEINRQQIIVIPPD